MIWPANRKNLLARAAKQRLQDLANDTSKPGAKILQQTINAKRTQGLNENYAREIMELHTLGVDGGYTQQDVTTVARALTGWSIMPMYKDGPGTKLLEAAGPGLLKRKGFVVEGDFLFKADKHDESAKTILGKNFPANGGYEEGKTGFTNVSYTSINSKIYLYQTGHPFCLRYTFCRVGKQNG